MSLILTPPSSRKPIKVHVGKWDEDLVSDAIRRELDRGGQVYYVSNRVKSIDDALARVNAAAPEARVAIAHGQQNEAQLESVMEDFAANKIDILIATTIIESGLDNPHTNTLIIEDSQRLGLSQLYQLKGRIGRSHNDAYAYFLFPSTDTLTDAAIDRLTAISEFNELGSGIRIAMRDLEIRGAGTLLGAEQSGNVSAVGFDLFVAMLNEAVEEAKSLSSEDEGEGAGAGGERGRGRENKSKSGRGDGRNQSATQSTTEHYIDINLPAFIPQSYVQNTDERVYYYRRAAKPKTLNEALSLEREILNRFGAPPTEVENMLAKTKALALMHTLHIESAVLTGGKLQINGIDLPESMSGRGFSINGHKTTYFIKSKKLTIATPCKESTLEILIDVLKSVFEESEKEFAELLKEEL
jgi:transcription-repair coupling factor (superfamily II helicase)